jgi:hypothetical protein
MLSLLDGCDLTIKILLTSLWILGSYIYPLFSCLSKEGGRELGGGDGFGSNHKDQLGPGL